MWWRPLRWRTSVLVLGLGVAAAASGPAHARQPRADGLVYETRLDLRLNPARAQPAPPSRGEPEELPQDKALSLDALVPRHPDDAELTRIIHGVMADRGQWPAAASLDILKEGARTGALCAGTVIDPLWILTAAHCVFDRSEGGLKPLRAVTAYTNSNVPRRGEARRVQAVVVHPMFAVLDRPGRPTAGLVNDIALLELEAPTTAPRQKLLADAAQPAALAAGNVATVIGWGLTRPRRPGQRTELSSLSKVLLRADVPIAGRGACDAFLDFPADASTDSVFCAGDGKGGADSCNGDSGGPIFVRGPAGEPLQAGIVSWGDGCALPGTYGAYTAVGPFQAWVRARVPQAQWVLPGETAPTLAAISGAIPGGPAAPLGQVTADIRVQACDGAAAVAPLEARAAAAANRVRIGACIAVLVTSGATGDLAVFNRDAAGETRQIFPNRLSGGGQVGQAPTRVRAGQVVRIPGDADGFDFRVSGPAGPNEIIAIVAPPGAGLGETARRFEGMHTIDGFEDVLDGIAARTRRIEIDPRAPRAVGTRWFEVVE
jgi:hypothetical protein